MSVFGPAPAARGDDVYNVFLNQLLQDVCFSLGSVIPQFTCCDTAKSVLFQALSWKSGLVNGKLFSEMWLKTQIAPICP